MLAATLHAGQLRWKQATHQSGLDNSSSSSSRQHPGEQQAEGEGEVAQQQLDHDVQRQIDYDVQQLAQDVFEKGQVLAGGRWERVWQCFVAGTRLSLTDGSSSSSMAGPAQARRVQPRRAPKTESIRVRAGGAWSVLCGLLLRMHACSWYRSVWLYSGPAATPA